MLTIGRSRTTPLSAGILRNRRNGQRFTYVPHPVNIQAFAFLSRIEPAVKKTLRILGVSLALLALLVFATGVVSDWNHRGANDDAHCPYCHLGHQTPAQLVAAPAVSMLKPVASLPLPQDAVQCTGPDFSQTSPRAPPSA